MVLKFYPSHLVDLLRDKDQIDRSYIINDNELHLHLKSNYYLHSLN